MKQTLIRVARNKVFWLLVISLASAAGLKMSPELQQALQIVGPEIATEIDKGENEQ